MRPSAARAGLALAGLVWLSACEPPDPAVGPSRARYLDTEVTPLDAALFRVVARMRGVRGPADAEDYARCRAAGYAQAAGLGFVRHVTTKVTERGGIWRADAVYTISSALPPGIRTIDAEVTAADCADKGIPTA
jgi:hypothetical protein